MLQKKLDKAVTAEDFEQAASLRDEIKADDATRWINWPRTEDHEPSTNFSVPPVESARRTGPHDRIVMSSRVRLARNLRSMAFPGWAKKAERDQGAGNHPARGGKPAAIDGCVFRNDGQPGPLDKQILVERHLISREHAAKSAGSGLVLNQEESLCVMINEEDHLRMQALRPGLAAQTGLAGHRPGGYRTGDASSITPSAPNWVI